MEFIDFTIASGAVVSDAKNMEGLDLSKARLLTPSALTNTTIDLEHSETSGGTFRTIQDTTGDLALTHAADSELSLADVNGPIKWLRLSVSGGAGNEAAERTFTIVCERDD